MQSNEFDWFILTSLCTRFLIDLEELGSYLMLLQDQREVRMFLPSTKSSVMVRGR